MSMYDLLDGINDYIKCIENNDKEANTQNIIAMKHHINVIYNNLLIFHKLEKITKIGYFITNQKLKYSLTKTDISIIRQELNIIIWLFNNIDYLYTYDDKNKAIAIVNIYYYLTLIDFDRVEFLEINSNKGRTIIASNPLENVKDYIDEIITNLTIFDDEDKELKRELIKNEKQI